MIHDKVSKSAIEPHILIQSNPNSNQFWWVIHDIKNRTAEIPSISMNYTIHYTVRTCLSWHRQGRLDSTPLGGRKCQLMLSAVKSAAVGP